MTIFYITSTYHLPFQNPDKKLRSIIKEYKKEIYGRDQKEDDEHDSPNSNLGAFIPTPKPRKRRKLFPQNNMNNNNSENEGDMELEYYQDPHVSFVVKAVSALTAAFRLVQLEQCAGNFKGIYLRLILHNANPLFF